VEIKLTNFNVDRRYKYNYHMTMGLASLTNKMKNKKYHTVQQIPKSNIKVVERDKFDNP
jgi:hypothetical protein